MSRRTHPEFLIVSDPNKTSRGHGFWTGRKSPSDPVEREGDGPVNAYYEKAPGEDDTTTAPLPPANRGSVGAGQQHGSNVVRSGLFIDLEKAAKPYGHTAYTRRTKSGKLVQVKAKGVRPAESPGPAHHHKIKVSAGLAGELMALEADPFSDARDDEHPDWKGPQGRMVLALREMGSGGGTLTLDTEALQVLHAHMEDVIDILENQASSGGSDAKSKGALVRAATKFRAGLKEKLSDKPVAPKAVPEPSPADTFRRGTWVWDADLDWEENLADFVYSRARSMFGTDFHSTSMRKANGDAFSDNAAGHRVSATGQIEFRDKYWRNITDLFSRVERARANLNPRPIDVSGYDNRDMDDRYALKAILHEHLHGAGEHKLPGMEWNHYYSPVGKMLQEGAVEALASLTVKEFWAPMGISTPNALVYSTEGEHPLRTHVYESEVNTVERLIALAHGHQFNLQGINDKVPQINTPEKMETLKDLCFRWPPLERSQRLATMIVTKNAPASDSASLKQKRADVIESKLAMLVSASKDTRTIWRVLTHIAVCPESELKRDYHAELNLGSYLRENRERNAARVALEGKIAQVLARQPVVPTHDEEFKAFADDLGDIFTKANWPGKWSSDLPVVLKDYLAVYTKGLHEAYKTGARGNSGAMTTEDAWARARLHLLNGFHTDMISVNAEVLRSRIERIKNGARVVW